jgi:hypothetical protein
MNNKKISKTIVYAFVTAFMLSAFTLSSNIEVFAFLGFNLFGTDEDQSSSTTSQTSNSLQSASCNSPRGSVIDSCNSGDLLNSTNTGYSSLGQ